MRQACYLIFPSLSIQDCKVVEGGGNCRVILSKSLLPDGQGVVEQVRGLLVLVLVPVHEGEDVQHGGHVGMVVSRSLFKVLQGLLAQRYSNFIPTSKISIATTNGKEQAYLP